MNLRKRTARLLIRLATPNNAEYLVSLNLKKLNEAGRPKDVDPREYYTALREKARSGPIFNEKTIAYMQELDFDLEKHEVQWLASNVQSGTNAPNVQELRGVMDYIRQQRPALEGLTYTKALEDSSAWHATMSHEPAESSGPYQTKNVVLDLKEQGCWVDVPPEDCETEGELMGHCVGGYSDSVKRGRCKIYSLRDRAGEPHVTIEMQRDTVVQIQGKQNRSPVEKYHKAISAFIAKMKPQQNEETAPYIDNLEDLCAAARNCSYTRTAVSILNNPLGKDSPEVLAAFMANTNYSVIHWLRNSGIVNPDMAEKVLDREISKPGPNSAGILHNFANDKNVPMDLLLRYYEKSKSSNELYTGFCSGFINNPAATTDTLRDMFKNRRNIVGDRRHSIVNTLCEESDFNEKDIIRFFRSILKDKLPSKKDAKAVYHRHVKAFNPAILSLATNKSCGAKASKLLAEFALHKVSIEHRSDLAALVSTLNHLDADMLVALEDKIRKAYADTGVTEFHAGNVPYEQRDTFQDYEGALTSLASSENMPIERAVNIIVRSPSHQEVATLAKRKDFTPAHATTLLAGIEERFSKPSSKRKYENYSNYESPMIALLWNAKLDAKTLRTYSKHTKVEFRAAVSENVNASPALLTKMALDSIAKVRRGVAKNPKTPIKVVQSLIEDKSDSVRRAADRAYAKRTGAERTIGPKPRNDHAYFSGPRGRRRKKKKKMRRGGPGRRPGH